MFDTETEGKAGRTRVLNDHNTTDALKTLVATLEAEAKRRVDARSSVEQRWLEDLRQYHGKYDSQTMQRIVDAGGSQLFINLTRAKTNAFSARLMDLLFPTDDKNWGIQPTPVPELVREIETAQDEVTSHKRTIDDLVSQQPDMGGEELAQNEAALAQVGQKLDAAQTEADRREAVMKEAREAAEQMSQEIDDQLKESRYSARCRDAIEQAAQIGTGVIKGPVLGDRMAQRWVLTEDGFTLQDREDARPGMTQVDAWGYFPDPDAKTPEDGESDFERHLMNRKKLRRLARRPDIDKDAVRRLLETGPASGSRLYWQSELIAINGSDQHGITDSFHVWEYNGPLEAEDLLLLADAFGETEDFEEVIGELDPLLEINCRIWFCQGELLSFALHPLDSGETLYSVFNPESDTSSAFGFGIPYLIRDPQSSLNAAWRAMMDNAGYSSGPQIVVDRDQVEPADGDWSLKPHKIWYRNRSKQGTTAFQSEIIPSVQPQLAGIIEMSRRDMDDVPSMPAIAQGEQGAGITKTAQGMALLMNSANVIFRRAVKNWDDDMTVPVIRRMYHWNMQFTPKDAIKGDYEVDARGSSVLLVREMQSQNLMAIAMQFSGHPVFGPMIKESELLRQIIKAHMIAADTIVKTDREIEAERAQMAESGPDPAVALGKRKMDLEERKIEAEVEIANMRAAADRQVAKLRYDAEMQKFAENLNENEADRISKAEEKAADREQSERKLATEVAMAQRTGKSSGGAI
jgi:hypothetical protein